MVIINMGTTISFQLGMPNHATNCPKCKKHVNPITCGFNNCEWRFMGIKYDEKNGPSKRVKSDWTKVDDNYYRFDPKRNGTVDWTYLAIETRESVRDEKKITTECNKQTIEFVQKAKSYFKVTIF